MSRERILIGKEKRFGAARCGLLCFLCAFACFAPFLFRDGGWFHVWSDFGWQQLPFGINLHNVLAEGNIGGWDWNYELGMSTVQAYSFYALGSPFYWLSLLFPAEWYPIVTGWTFLLKYTVAGMTAYCYIRRFVRRDPAAVAGALLYAFSGFQAANLMYYHFHDAVALFPLLLLGMERVLEDPRDRGMMVFAVFINALNNYYFFVMEAVFAVIYFLFRFFADGAGDLGEPAAGGRKERFLRLLRLGGNCLLCGIWGGAMAAVLLVPSFLYLMGSSRSHVSLQLTDLIRDSRWFLYILKGMLLPGDTLIDQFALYDSEFDSNITGIPMAGIGLALVFVWKHRRKHWLGGLLMLLIALCFTPFFSSVFLLFTECTGRWMYFLTLMIALGSAKVMEAEEEYPVRKGLLFYFLPVLGFCLLLRMRPYDSWTYREIYNETRFLVFAGLGLGGIAVLLLLHRFRKLGTWWATGTVFLFCAVTTFITLNNYYHCTGDGVSNNNLRTGMRLETHDDQYRYNLSNNQFMLPGGGSGMTVFSSTISKGSREFDSLFGYYSVNHSLKKGSMRGLAELFAARYYLSGEEPEPGAAVQIVDTPSGPWYVLEDRVCPIGFAVDRYILRENLLAIPEENRGAALLYAVVIDPEEEEKVSGLCRKTTGEDLPLAEDLSGIVTENTENAVREFERDSRGFRCVSAFDRERMVYFSVPDEGGWSAFVDGEKREILPSAGMMLLRVPAGRHEIRFEYVTPGYRAGLLVSGLAAAAFAAYLAIGLLKRRGKGRTGQEASQTEE